MMNPSDILYQLRKCLKFVMFVARDSSIANDYLAEKRSLNVFVAKVEICISFV